MVINERGLKALELWHEYRKVNVSRGGIATANAWAKFDDYCEAQRFTQSERDALLAFYACFNKD